MRAVRILLRAGLVLLILVVVLSLVGGGLTLWTVRRSFPDYAGEERLPGLRAEVTVRWDSHGIPQVYARSTDDLFRAQGYLHARDRFWEMDFRRHITSGRLSELFGASEVETDRYLRTMGWRRVAEQEYPRLSPDTQRYLRAYADGVNAWLGDHDGSAASLEYGVLGLRNRGYRIATWDPVDSVAWLKAMAWDLRGNMGAEIDRAILLGSGLSRAQVEQLYPAYPVHQHTPIVPGGTVSKDTFTGTDTVAAGAGGGGPVTSGPVSEQPATGARPAPATATAPATDSRPNPATDPSSAVAADAVPALRAVGAALRRLPPLLGANSPDIGSNSWVIAGSRTSTGKPILANDPHLSPSLPAIWYQIGLHCLPGSTSCDINAEGFSFSGVPGVVIGHNARIAWGFTNLDPDVTDLYLEQVDGDRYLVDGKWLPLTERAETIRVAGGDDVHITVRTTKHGPLLSDQSAELRRIGRKPPTAESPGPASPGSPDGTVTAGPDGYAIALRWTALDPGRTMDALFELDTAANWTDFRAAAEKFAVPAQNMVYADVDGNIGYQAPGTVPIRGKGDGRWPAPGWDSLYDWTGTVPFSAMPTEFNPARGYVVTANQAVVGPDYPYLLTRDWTYGYRSQRINDLITGHHGPISVNDVTSMQFDARNTSAETIVSRLLAVRLTGRAATARNLLRDWDYQQSADSAAAAFYNATWRHLLAGTFDELPADYQATGGERWFEVVRGLIVDPGSPWWDDQDTSRHETRDDQLRAAMTAAADELYDRLGDEPGDWRWGDLHKLALRNQSFGTSGIGPIEWLFNVDPVSVAGGSGIVNATGWDASAGYEVTAVPSMRMTVDLGDFDRSRWVQFAGNSGHAFSDHYTDQLELWRTGRTLPMRWAEASVKRETADTLTLTPDRS